MRKFLIVMYVSIAECKVIKISCLLGGFLRIIIIIKLKNAKFAAWIKCSAVATAPWFIFFENGREFCRKVLLKFYLPHSNLAVRISSEDTIAIAPALIAVSMPVRPCISISVWGCCFIRCCGTPRPECGIKQRYISHTFFICFYECLCRGVRMSMFFAMETVALFLMPLHQFLYIAEISPYWGWIFLLSILLSGSGIVAVCLVINIRCNLVMWPVERGVSYSLCSVFLKEVCW